MADMKTTTVSTAWLYSTLKLLNELAGEGITIEGCEEPESLMSEIATYLGVGDADDPWEAAVNAVGSDV